MRRPIGSGDARLVCARQTERASSSLPGPCPRGTPAHECLHLNQFTTPRGWQFDERLIDRLDLDDAGLSRAPNRQPHHHGAGTGQLAEHPRLSRVVRGIKPGPAPDSHMRQTQAFRGLFRPCVDITTELTSGACRAAAGEAAVGRGRSRRSAAAHGVRSARLRCSSRSQSRRLARKIAVSPTSAICRRAAGAGDPGGVEEPVDQPRQIEDHRHPVLRMAGIQLRAQHLAGHLAMRRERVEPAHDHARAGARAAAGRRRLRPDLLSSRRGRARTRRWRSHRDRGTRRRCQPGRRRGARPPGSRRTFVPAALLGEREGGVDDPDQRAAAPAAILPAHSNSSARSCFRLGSSSSANGSGRQICIAARPSRAASSAVEHALPGPRREHAEQRGAGRLDRGIAHQLADARGEHVAQRPPQQTGRGDSARAARRRAGRSRAASRACGRARSRRRARPAGSARSARRCRGRPGVTSW